MDHKLGQATDQEVLQKSGMMQASSENHCFHTAYALRRYAQTRRLWDTPILETPSFVVLPTVGPLVEGWLLIVPKTRVLSFARVARGEFSQLEALLAKTVALVEAKVSDSIAQLLLKLSLVNRPTSLPARFAACC